MPRNKLYRLDPAAWQELEAADDWYRHRNPEASVRFLAAIYDALETIVESPERWPRYLRGTRRFILHRFPYFIVYRDEATMMSIVAIAHNKRRPGYWKDRP